MPSRPALRYRLAMRTSATTLKKIAGVVWLGVGVMLAVRGLGMVFVKADASAAGAATSLVLGVLLGSAKGKFALGQAARRNIKRIDALADPRIWHVFAPMFAVLIALMIGVGAALRAAAARGWLGGWIVVGGIYVGIGAALVVSSAAYLLEPRPPLPTRTDAPPARRNRRTGLMLVNLGTPDAPTPGAVRRYLRQFLSDPRVVEFPRPLWWVILNLFVLPIRSRASAAAYRSVWTERGSPLLHHMQDAAAALRPRLGGDWDVEVAMRYGNPSLGAALDRLTARGCEPVVVMPFFPQFSNATTGSIQAELARLAFRRRDQPALQFVPPYPDHPGYLDALAVTVAEAREGRPVDFTVISFHGLPEKYVEGGDPYVDHCTRTTWGLVERLGLERHEWEMAFQSRFGPDPWLQPYLDELVPALAGDHERVQVVLPGFACDCVETLEEVGIRLRAAFAAAGGGELIVTPCLNARDEWVAAVEELVRRAAAPFPLSPASR